MRSNRPHQDVADRVRFFLDAVGLSREEFVRAVDGAIGVRSLYSVLNGARRPSRALAVLIERTWGFRADYLLDGRGAVWTEAQELGPGVVAVELSQSESAVIQFMRTSLENARTLAGELDQAKAWSRVFARTLDLIRELDACGNSESEGSRRIYPMLAKVVYEDCRFMSDLHEQLSVLLLRHRIYKLKDGFLDHFLDDMPQRVLSASEYAPLRSSLSPILDRRRKQLRSLERGIDETYATIDEVCSLGSPTKLVEAHLEEREHRQRRQTEERLARLVEGRLEGRLATIVDELAGDPDPSATFTKQLHQLLRDLLKDLGEDIPVVRIHTAEDLRRRYDAILDPLTV